MRFAKAAAMLVALASSIYAYNDHDKFYFTQIMAGFITIITGLLAVAYWGDALLRIISGTVFLCSLNNLYDELFGNPYKFENNEKIFAFFIAVFLFLNLFLLIRQMSNGTPDNTAQ